MTSELIERQTLSTLAEHYNKAAQLAQDGLAMLIEAQQLMKAALGSSYDNLFPHGRLDGYTLGQRELDESQTQIRENFWHYTMAQTGIRDLMSPADRARMDKMFEDHETPAFTLDTLLSTLQGLAENQGDIFAQAVKECWEYFRPRSAAPAHKTNSPYQIKDKIIRKSAVEVWCGRWQLNYYREDMYRELDKVFHGLDGKGLPKHPLDAVTAIKEAMQQGYSEAETPYFKFKWYKAGTMHIWFNRLDLLKEFNRIGAAGSANLPG